MSGIVGNGHDPDWPPLIRPAQFLAAHEPPEWLIDGVVQHGRVYACTSLTSHGKTATWLYNGTMVQAGRKVAGLEVAQGNVLMMMGENPDDGRARMHGMKRALNLKDEDFPVVLPATYQLTADQVEQLRFGVTVRLGIKLSLIVVDTAPAFFPFEDENQNVPAGDWARILRMLTEMPGHPAVIALCHPIKNASKDNLLPRGGGAFLNELDGNLTLWSEELGEQTTLHWQGKIRGPSFAPINYRLRSVPTGFVDKRGRDEMTVIAEPVDEFEAASRRGQRLADENAVLKAFINTPDASYRDIALRMGWVGKDGKGQGWKVQDAIQKLAKARLMKSVHDEWQVTDLGKTYAVSKGL